MAAQPQTDVSRCRHIASRVGSLRGARMERQRGFVVVAALAGVLLLGVVVSASAKLLVSTLAARDPGARLDGDTIVVTGKGGRVVGAQDRSNFIVALGSGQTIVGGPRHDELGALGDNVTIQDGGGNDLIHAGRGVTLVRGSGGDLISEANNDATVRVTSPRNEVVVSGRRDRVLCAKGSRKDVIYARTGDFISSACRAAGARVLPVARFHSAPPPASARGGPPPITGDGSNDNPFTTSCNGGDLAPTYPDVCSVAFRPVTIEGGFWANGYVPAYKCPAEHPYLFNENFAPIGTALPNGVAVAGLGPVGVYIDRDSVSSTQVPPGGGHNFNFYRTGTLTGVGTSYTNWDGLGPSFTVSLWCTNELSHGYHEPG